MRIFRCMSVQKLQQPCGKKRLTVRSSRKRYCHEWQGYKHTLSLLMTLLGLLLLYFALVNIRLKKMDGYGYTHSMLNMYMYVQQVKLLAACNQALLCGKAETEIYRPFSVYSRILAPLFFWT